MSKTTTAKTDKANCDRCNRQVKRATLSHDEATGQAICEDCANPNLCGCGCGQPTRNTYRPGHDARAAGQVGRALIAGTMSKAEAQLLLSPALLAKALRMAETKATKKTPKTKPATETGTVKVGRWIYDATRLGDEVEYRTRQGETKTADAKTAATFATTEATK